MGVIVAGTIDDVNKAVFPLDSDVACSTSVVVGTVVVDRVDVGV